MSCAKSAQRWGADGVVLGDLAEVDGLRNDRPVVEEGHAHVLAEAAVRPAARRVRGALDGRLVVLAAGGAGHGVLGVERGHGEGWGGAAAHVVGVRQADVPVEAAVQG